MFDTVLVERTDDELRAVVDGLLVQDRDIGAGRVVDAQGLVGSRIPAVIGGDDAVPHRFPGAGVLAAQRQQQGDLLRNQDVLDAAGQQIGQQCGLDRMARIASLPAFHGLPQTGRMQLIGLGELHQFHPAAQHIGGRGGAQLLQGPFGQHGQGLPDVLLVGLDQVRVAQEGFPFDQFVGGFEPVAQHAVGIGAQIVVIRLPGRFDRGRRRVTQDVQYVLGAPLHQGDVGLGQVQEQPLGGIPRIGLHGFQYLSRLVQVAGAGEGGAGTQQ